MKLLNAIAVAAVIGASFITTIPAEAQKYYGWKYIGSSKSGGDMYAKIISRSQGGDPRLLINTRGTTFESELTCLNWVYKNTTDRYWFPIMPGSMMDSVAKKFC
jgi:hypothetical protein